MKKLLCLLFSCVCALSMNALTYNVTVPAGTKACYIAGEMNAWSQTEMTKVDDTHYTLDVADATKEMKYKYCSGPAWAYVECGADDSELGDRVYAEYDEVAKWRSVYDPGVVPSEPKDITVKAKVPATWTESITAWVWPTGGAGEEVIPTQEGDWYVVTKNCTELNIIFKNGAGWNGDANQTVDMTFSEDACVDLASDGASKATYTVVDCEGGFVGTETLTYNVTVPAGTKACYIAGEMTGWIQVEMTPVDDTHYTLELEGTSTMAAYKYCSGPDWKYVETTKDGAEVLNRTYTANDEVEAWLEVYDPEGSSTPEETRDITVKAIVPAAWTNDITAWVWPTGGEGKEVSPIKDGDWYVVTEHCAELNIIFKNGIGWNGDANQTEDITGIKENTCIKITSDGVNKATYALADCNGVTTYYVTGNANLVGAEKAWKADAIEMTEEAGVYTHTFVGLAADLTYQLKITDGTWDFSYGYGNVLHVPAGVTGDGDGNILFALAEAGDVVVTFDGTTITLAGNFAEVTGEVSYVLMGVGGDWTTGITMELNPGNPNEYILLGQAIKEGDAVKVVKISNGAAVSYYGNVDEASVKHDFDKDGNILLAAGMYDFYYKVAEELIYIGEPQATGVEDVITTNNVSKFIYNGQIVVLRDGIKFNMMGQEVK